MKRIKYFLSVALISSFLVLSGAFVSADESDEKQQKSGSVKLLSSSWVDGEYQRVVVESGGVLSVVNTAE